MKRKGVAVLVLGVGMMMIILFIFSNVLVRMDNNTEATVTSASSMGDFYTLNTLNILLVRNDRRIESLTQELIEGNADPSEIEYAANDTLKVTSKEYRFEIDGTDVELRRKNPPNLGSESAYLTTRTGPKKMMVVTDRENIVPEAKEALEN